MGIRQKLNDASKAVIVIIVVVVLAIYGIVFWEMHHPAYGSHASGESYYTTDDGNTYFADDATLFPPIDHNGSPAVRCYVFKDPSGTKFVGYLEEFSPEVHKALTTPFDPAHRGDMAPLNFAEGTLVKRPGDKNWTIKASPKGEQITHPKCPDGSSQDPTLVNP